MDSITAPVAEADHTPEKPTEAVLNETWWDYSGSLALEIPNPDNISLDTYREMIRNDETVASASEYIKMSAMARLGEYQNEDEEIQDFVRENLRNIEGSWMSAVSEIMSAYDYGFSTTEKLYRYRDKKVWLRGLQTLIPTTVSLDYHREGPDKNKLKTIWQHHHAGHEVEIPVDKVVHFPFNGAFGNHYGESRLKAAYPNWYIKKRLVKAGGIAMERFGTPLAIGNTESTTPITVGGTSGTQMSPVQALAKNLDCLGSRGSMATGGKTTVTIHYPPPGCGESILNQIAYHNKMIYRALGLPSLIADHGDTGSYSLGKQHYKLFTLILEKLLYELCEVLISQLIRPLIELNFGPQEHYGEFAIESFDTEEAKALAEYFAILADKGFIDAEDIDELNMVRSQLGLKPREQEDLQPSEPDDSLDLAS